MSLAETLTAGPGRWLVSLKNKFSTNDTSRNNQNSPTEKHCERGHDSTDVRLGNNIAKPHGCHRHDGPINGNWNTCEAVLRTLNYVHYSPHN